MTERPLVIFARRQIQCIMKIGGRMTARTRKAIVTVGYLPIVVAYIYLGYFFWAEDRVLFGLACLFGPVAGWLYFDFSKGFISKNTRKKDHL